MKKKKTFCYLKLLFFHHNEKNSHVKLCSVSGDTKSSSASTLSSRAMVLLQLLWWSFLSLVGVEKKTG